MLRISLMVFALTLLSACYFMKENDRNEATKRINPGQTCEAVGYTPGNAAYDQCVRDEQSGRMKDND